MSGSPWEPEEQGGKEGRATPGPWGRSIIIQYVHTVPTTNTTKKFPKKKGWITAKLSLKRGATLTEEEVRHFISAGAPHGVQVGLVDVSCNPVKIIFRDIGEAALDPDETPEELVLIDSKTHDFVKDLPPLPFIAKCGNLVVKALKIREDLAPLPVMRCHVVSGLHFNDHGDYGPGDEVNIGPLTTYWRILKFADRA